VLTRLGGGCPINILPRSKISFFPLWRGFGGGCPTNILPLPPPQGEFTLTSSID